MVQENIYIFQSFEKEISFLFPEITNILDDIRPSSNGAFSFNNHRSTSFLTWLCVDWSHLRDHTLNVSLIHENTVSLILKAICACKNSIESFLIVSNFTLMDKSLLHKIGNIYRNILMESGSSITKTLLYGTEKVFYLIHPILTQ